MSVIFWAQFKYCNTVMSLWLIICIFSLTNMNQHEKTKSIKSEVISSKRESSVCPTYAQFIILILTPIITSFGRLGNSFISTRDVPSPSSIPNCESIPSVNSMRKNKTAQNCAPGNWLIASVKIINAKPVPDALCLKSKVNKTPNKQFKLRTIIIPQIFSY